MMINKDKKGALPLEAISGSLPIKVPSESEKLFYDLINKKMLELSGNVASTGNLNAAIVNLKGSKKISNIDFNLTALQKKYQRTVASYPVRAVMREVKQVLLESGFGFKAAPASPLTILKNEVARLIRIYQLIKPQMSDGISSSLNPLIENLKLLVDFKEK